MKAPVLSKGSGAVVLGLGVVLLVLLQVTLLNFLPTPWAAPDVVVVAVLALAVARGPVAGALVGAWAGFVLDVVPPALGPLGGWMLVLAVVGAALGRVADTYRPGPVAAMGLVAVAAGIVILGRVAVLWFAGVPAQGSVLGSAVASALWGLILAPLALLIVTRAARSATPEPSGAPRPPGATNAVLGRGRR